MPREPQSYGSQGDWVTGNVDEEVNHQKSEPASHRDFYDNRRDSEHSGPDQGGRISEEQLADNVQPQTGAVSDIIEPARKITAEEGGARRGGYFKSRDYSS